MTAIIDHPAFTAFLDELGILPEEVDDMHVRAFRIAQRHCSRTELETERDELRAQVDEAEEKIAFLSQGCLSMSRDELIQRITAVEPARWRAGMWLSGQIRPYSKRLAELEGAAAVVETITSAAHVPHGPAHLPERTADAHYLREAAQHIEDGYKVGGSNLTATVIRLLRTVATALEAPSSDSLRLMMARCWREGWQAERTKFHTTAPDVTCPYDQLPAEHADRA